jgi:hypothetical protein
MKFKNKSTSNERIPLFYKLNSTQSEVPVLKVGKYPSKEVLKNR